MLDTLSKKELEKFLGVTRKFHQASIVHGIHVLRIMKYDRQALAMRRLQCDNVDADPIVWTNQRFVRWARSIDLGEYAENLKGKKSNYIIIRKELMQHQIESNLRQRSSWWTSCIGTIIHRRYHGNCSGYSTFQKYHTKTSCY